MKLEKINSKSLIYFENFINQRNYSCFCDNSEVDKKYQPKHSFSGFDLPYFDLDKNKVAIITANPDKEISKLYLNDCIKFPVHPETLSVINSKNCHCLAGKMKVYPTASTRTVLTKGNPKHFLKLHLPKRISRYNRRLRDTSVTHSILISRDLEKTSLPDFFGFLPETIGVFQISEKWGYIIREFDPRPRVEEKRFLIPFFGLYSFDENYPNQPNMLSQLANRSGKDPKSFLVKNILGPLIQSWAFIAKNRGIVLEMHGQNTLLEVNSDLKVCRIIYRDFQSLPVDFEIRSDNKLENKFNKHLIGRDGFVREQEFSLTYDYLIFHHMIVPLVQTFVKEFGLDAKFFYFCLREILHNSFKNYKDFFPEDVSFRFKNKVFSNNESELEEVPGQPIWR